MIVFMKTMIVSDTDLSLDKYIRLNYKLCCYKYYKTKKINKYLD